jgi:hypothetical protein
MVSVIIQSVSEGYKSSYDGMIVNNKLEQWKVVVVQSKVLHQHLTGDSGKKKSEAIPVTGHGGPQGCEMLTLPHFINNVHAHCLYQGTHQAWAFPFLPLLFAFLILHQKLTTHIHYSSPSLFGSLPKTHTTSLPCVPFYEQLTIFRGSTQFALPFFPTGSPIQTDSLAGKFPPFLYNPMFLRSSLPCLLHAWLSLQL